MSTIAKRKNQYVRLKIDILILGKVSGNGLFVHIWWGLRAG